MNEKNIRFEAMLCFEVAMLMVDNGCQSFDYLAGTLNMARCVGAITTQEFNTLMVAIKAEDFELLRKLYESLFLDVKEGKE